MSVGVFSVCFFVFSVSFCKPFPVCLFFVFLSSCSSQSVFCLSYIFFFTIVSFCAIFDFHTLAPVCKFLRLFTFVISSSFVCLCSCACSSLSIFVCLNNHLFVYVSLAVFSTNSLPVYISICYICALFCMLDCSYYFSTVCLSIEIITPLPVCLLSCVPVYPSIYLPQFTSLYSGG